MRNLLWQMNVTLDGYIEGPHRELDDTAHVESDDFNRYVSDMLGSIGAILLGRRTYEYFAGHWPTATGPDADAMNALPKVVFSRSLQTVAWTNARLVTGDVVDEVARVKREPGNDLALFGSANLASTLVPTGLIDEYRIFINPVVLGEGTPMFNGVKTKLPLRLMRATTMDSGIVALSYQPA